MSKLRGVQKTDKDVVISNQVSAFIEQETLSIAMEIGYQEAMDLWLEIWRAVELCMVCFHIYAILFSDSIHIISV